jgi:aminoglycoside 6'-N-acetyltransferase I
VCAADVRPAVPADLDAIVALATALWPDGDDHRPHMAATLAGAPRSTLPLTLFIAERAGVAVGFIEVGLRSHADGCDGRRAVGFIEGWYVTPAHRGQSVGRALMAAAESWARAQGCTEIASDTWADNEASIVAHQALGFEISERLVTFRKPL